MHKIFCLMLVVASNSFAYDYPKPIDGYFSQKGQDKYLNEQIFKGKRGGVFVEVGAHDGVSFSNSYFFEKFLGWQGICVEPNPSMLRKLTENRQCICEPVAIAFRSEKMLFLKCSGYILEMYSGLVDRLDPRHLNRIYDEMIEYGGSAELITVNCEPLYKLFDKHNLSFIDFLSLDVEGGELNALKSIDFDKIEIDIIVVENNFNEDTVYNYLSGKGYERIKRLGKDDVYRLKKVAIKSDRSYL